MARYSNRDLQGYAPYYASNNRFGGNYDRDYSGRYDYNRGGYEGSYGSRSGNYAADYDRDYGMNDNYDRRYDRYNVERSGDVDRSSRVYGGEPYGSDDFYGNNYNSGYGSDYRDNYGGNYAGNRYAYSRSLSDRSYGRGTYSGSYGKYGRTPSYDDYEINRYGDVYSRDYPDYDEGYYPRGSYSSGYYYGTRPLRRRTY